MGRPGLTSIVSGARSRNTLNVQATIQLNSEWGGLDSALINQEVKNPSS
jgi:hypothetical protein